MIKKNNLFYDFFELGNVYNKTCFECKYRASTLADLRIGDYWGKEFNGNKTGMSMVIVNSKKGNDVLQKLIKDKAITANKQYISDYYNYQQTVNVEPVMNRKEIIKQLKNKDIDLKTISKRYCKKVKREKEIKKKILHIYQGLKGIITNGKK